MTIESRYVVKVKFPGTNKLYDYYCYYYIPPETQVAVLVYGKHIKLATVKQFVQGKEAVAKSKANKSIIGIILAR